MFVDGELRHQVQKLALRPKSDGSRDPVAKRRRLNGDESLPWLELTSQLCQLIGVDLDNPMDELEPRILCVAPACLTTFS
jgi:hypothetical protein